jgi:ADP-heptose:LPS heptosyltransferase
MVSQLCGIEPVWPLRPHIEVSPGDRVAADEFLYGFGNDHSALIACCPFTRQARGQWPETFFVDTVNALAKEIAIRVLVCGSAAELGRLNAFARELGAPCKVQAGELNLPAFAALLSRCSVVFSQDSGPRHIGNAAGAPVVFVRNLWFLPEEAGAYCASETDAAPAVPFASEGVYAAVQDSLLPATVAEKLLRILSG